MWSRADIEVTKRSAAMAPLSTRTVDELLDEMQRLVVEREQIAAILSDLPSTMGALRTALNDLHRLVT